VTNSWSDIHAHNRKTEALAERLELRIHAIAIVLTAIVLCMRLIAGRADLTSEDASPPAPAGEQAPIVPPVP
jgi:hypothetical protein